MKTLVVSAVAAVLVTAFAVYFCVAIYHWLSGTPDKVEGDDPIDGRGAF